MNKEKIIEIMEWMIMRVECGRDIDATIQDSMVEYSISEMMANKIADAVLI